MHFAKKKKIAAASGKPDVWKSPSLPEKKRKENSSPPSARPLLFFLLHPPVPPCLCFPSQKNGGRRARVFDGCRRLPLAFPKCNSSPPLLSSEFGEKWAKGEAIKPFRFVLVPLFLSSFLRGRCPRILRRFSAKIYGALSDGGGGSRRSQRCISRRGRAYSSFGFVIRGDFAATAYGYSRRGGNEFPPRRQGETWNSGNNPRPPPFPYLVSL